MLRLYVLLAVALLVVAVAPAALGQDLRSDLGYYGGGYGGGQQAYADQSQGVYCPPGTAPQIVEIRIPETAGQRWSRYGTNAVLPAGLIFLGSKAFTGDKRKQSAAAGIGGGALFVRELFRGRKGQKAHQVICTPMAGGPSGYGAPAPPPPHSGGFTPAPQAPVPAPSQGVKYWNCFSESSMKVVVPSGETFMLGPTQAGTFPVGSVAYAIDSDGVAWQLSQGSGLQVIPGGFKGVAN